MNSPGGQIRNEIAERGAIPFARFMELALYCPLCGYYEKKKDTPGQRGDFYTSVSVGSLFGELLAFQFAEWLEALPVAGGRWPIIEAGAHDGCLAKDILTWLRLRRHGLLERIEYWIVEPSARRREWQREVLKEFEPRVRWFGDFHSLATILLWPAANRQSAIGNLPPELLDVLPDGFTTEICPAAVNWWREAASGLKQGKLLTLDYGLSAEEFFAPQRVNGTLRAYHHHRLSGDALANPGEQDLTAHVNFTAIQRAGERVGLKMETFASQTQFLTGIAQRAWREGSNFGPWTREHTRQFQTLTHPDHLGRSFRVLLQSSTSG